VPDTGVDKAAWLGVMDNFKTTVAASQHVVCIGGGATGHTLHPTPYTLHLHPTPAPYTQHPTPYTLHLASYTLHPTTLNLY
jgi:hypothetical protein